MESLGSISSIVKRGPKNAYEEILLEGYKKADKENKEKIQKIKEEFQKEIEERQKEMQERQKEMQERQKAAIKRNIVKTYKCGLKPQQLSEAFEISVEEVQKILRNEGLI